MKKLTQVFCLLLIVTTIGVAQQYKPAIDMVSLLNMRFYQQNGGFMVDEVMLVFPPAGADRVTFELTKSDGSVVSTLPLQIQPYGSFEVFSILRPVGHPGVINFGQAGDYIINFKINNEVITRLPFEVKVETSGDPFNPGKEFTREGMWETHGFFSYDPTRADQGMQFNCWLRLQETGETRKSTEIRQFPKITAHIMRGSEEIAVSKPISASSRNWQWLQLNLMDGRYLFTIDKLTANDGDYEVVIKADGEEVKTYEAEVSGGTLQSLEQSALGYEPHEDFLCPRTLSNRERTASRAKMQNIYWVEKD